jgi:hypothetical protein
LGGDTGGNQVCNKLRNVTVDGFFGSARNLDAE